MNSLPDINASIGVVGLGYVGLPLAVEFAKCRSVVGFDINPERIEDLNNGVDKTLEVSSGDLDRSPSLEFTANVEDLKACEIYIVTVPTPIDDVNRPNLTPLIEASEAIGNILKAGDLVIFESTVYPGCTEEICVPILASTSGLEYNKDFFCGYSPERINPGDKVNTLTKIKKITSGSTFEVALIVDELYKSIITAGTFPAASIIVAEAAKVIENTQRDLNIALVNELSVIFERLNIDTLDVLEAAGSKWNFLPFRPGMVGGHCIGVDPYYLTHKAEMVGYNPQVILAGRRINDNMARYVARNLIKRMVQNKIDVTTAKVGILGITFKENCPDIRNTKVIDIINELTSWGVEVLLCDPWASELEVESAFSLRLKHLGELNELDGIVVAVGHSEFRSLNVSDLRKMTRGPQPVLADVKSIYDRDEISENGFTVFRL